MYILIVDSHYIFVFEVGKYITFMKTDFKIIAVLMLIGLSSCEKDGSSASNPSVADCPPNQLPQQVRSLNVIDPKASAGSNPIIASFKLSQDLETYNNTANCKNKIPNCAVKLFIKNTSDRKLLFDYTVNFTSGSNTWQYEGFSSMAPNAYDSIGVISKNCGWISDATITVTPGNISFQ